MEESAQALTITELNHHIKTWLEHDFSDLLVTGELSNLIQAGSGHLYFILKDKQAQIRCVYFRQHHLKNLSLKNGQQIFAKGTVSLYEPRGDYQFIIHDIIESGIGELYRQFELLKNKLDELGLFSAAGKKNLPRFPHTIGIITSINAAALQDILTTLKKQFPLVKVLIYHAPVQGKEAAVALIKSLEQANLDQKAEILILARGGGSIEDLWAFNNEALAYSISNSTIPIITGIGHEIDFTIADFVADKRAATPTAAAQLAVPNSKDLLKYIGLLKERLLKSIRFKLNQTHHNMTQIKNQLISPVDAFTRYSQSLDYLMLQLPQLITQTKERQINQLDLLKAKLYGKNPLLNLHNQYQKVIYNKEHLVKNMQAKLNELRSRLSSTLTALNIVSPLNTLKRGYSITRFNNKILYDSKYIKPGSVVNVHLAQGQLTCMVQEID